MANELTVFEQLEQEAREGYLAREMPHIIELILARKPRSFGNSWEKDREELRCRINIDNTENIQQQQIKDNIRREKFNLPLLHVYNQQDFDNDVETLRFLKELEPVIEKALKQQDKSFLKRIWYFFAEKKIDWDSVYQAYAEEKAREIVLAQCASWTPRQLILEFQRGRIEDIRDATVGEESTFVKNKVSTAAFLERLQSVKSRLQLLIEADPFNDIFRHVLMEVESKIAETNSVYQEMLLFENKAKDLVGAQLAKIAFLEDPLQKLEIVREARALCDGTDDVIANAEAAISIGLMTFGTGFQEMRKQIVRAYEESGIALAVDASGQNETFSMGVLDRLIDQHVPAKLEVVEKVS